MTKYFLLSLYTYSVTLLSCTSQTNNDRLMLGEAYAKKELEIALSGKGFHNVINGKTILLKNKETAIKVVEPILFDLYGKENIVDEQPYETYFINNHWVIFGTLPKGYVGGTFLIIVDATNSKIIRLTHAQ